MEQAVCKCSTGGVSHKLCKSNHAFSETLLLTNIQQMIEQFFIVLSCFIYYEHDFIKSNQNPCEDTKRVRKLFSANYFIIINFLVNAIL